MRIKCIANKGNLFGQDASYEIRIDSEYNVYAIKVCDGFPWYYIEEVRSNELKSFPAFLFDVVDNRLSQYWVFSNIKGPHYNLPRSIFTFPEWAEDPDYYDKLLKNFDREVELFDRYKLLMDHEFPNPEIQIIAKIIDKYWIQCPQCSDAWETKSVAGIVVCPSCKTIMNNPKYISKPTQLKDWLKNEN